MIAEMVTRGSRVADIGTDHGFLPIWLLQTDRVPYAIAMDVGKGPLEQAKANMQKAGVEERMELRRSDGLSALKHGEADSIVISGMGGILIRTILEQGEELAREAAELILSPQSDIPLLRTYLRTSGFRITDEDMTADSGKYYVVIKAVFRPDYADADKSQTYEDEYGPVLLKKRPPAFLSMLRTQKETNDKIIQMMELAEKNEETTGRMQMLLKRQTEISQILEAEIKEISYDS